MSHMIKKINRNSPAFHAGMAASARGETADDCPFRAWTQRQEAREWMAGFDEPRARSVARVPPAKNEQVDLEQILPAEAHGFMRR